MASQARPEIEKLNIAILGAGIAGLALAIALSSHPEFEVTVFEKATELKEIGASIALGPNGLRTLEKLGAGGVVSEEVGWRGTGLAGMVYRHWKTNEVIGRDVHLDVEERLHQTTRFHRGHLHAGLLAQVEAENVVLGKKVIGVEILGEGKGVKLKFQDGSEATADLVVGADGLHSGVRQALVPELKLKWSGSTAFRSVFDVSLVESIPDLPEDSAHWWGPDSTFFASRLGGGVFTVVGGVSADPGDENAVYKDVAWDQDGDVEVLREKYKNWNPVVKALTEVTPYIRYYPNLACSAPLDTWIFGDRITLIGDAAHAHGGAFATGGSLAIDDAYALYLSLISVLPVTAGRIPTSEEIGKALKLYEATRKPHTDRLLKMVLAGNNAKVEKVTRGILETDEELRARAARGANTSWLHEHDVVKTFEDTLRKFRSSDKEEESDKVLARL